MSRFFGVVYIRRLADIASKSGRVCLKQEIQRINDKIFSDLNINKYYVYNGL